MHRHVAPTILCPSNLDLFPLLKKKKKKFIYNSKLIHLRPFEPFFRVNKN